MREEKEKSGKTKKLKLFSDIFKGDQALASLREVKQQTIDFNREKIERHNTVHSFVNLRDLLSEEEKCEEGKEEITNFGSTYNAAQINIAPLESMILGTDQLADIVVDRNDSSCDAKLSVEISRWANFWLFTNSAKFHQLWRTAIGEAFICGGGPALYDRKDEGLYPRYNINMLFPAGAQLFAEGISYAFERREIELGHLENLLALTSEDNKNVDREAIEKLVKQIRENIQGKGTGVIGDGDALNHKNARGSKLVAQSKIVMWTYWEVRTWTKDSRKGKPGTQYVSRIDFIDGHELSGISREHQAVVVLAQEQIAAERPADWLVMIDIDEEIGGEKSVETLRGIGEAFSRAAMRIEELKNIELDGAIEAARPLFEETEGANPEEMLKFNPAFDRVMPPGVRYAQRPNYGSHFSPIVAGMTQVVAGIANSGVSNTNRGQELRQQAVERQQNGAQIQSNRATKAYMKLDAIVSMVVHRALTLEPETGSEDYELIRGFQECVDEEIVHFHKLEDDDQAAGQTTKDSTLTAMQKAGKMRMDLAAKRYGKFRYLTVKARRNATGLDRVTEDETANFLLELLKTGRISEEAAPLVLERAIAYKTGNSDIAELVVVKPEAIRADQMQQAANEWEAIGRRSLVNQAYPIGAGDIDGDHVQAHLLDLAADVNRHQIRPWDQDDFMQFTAHVQHVGAHLERMRQRPESAGIAKQVMPKLQEIIANGHAIAKEIAEQRDRQNQTGENLSPDDRIKLAKARDIEVGTELKAQKFGAEIEKNQQVAQQRIERGKQSQDRNDLMERQQYANEINKQQKLELEKQKLQQQQAQPNDGQ